jgi:hypothetical protein
MRYLVIILFTFTIFVLGTNPAFASCAYDPSSPHAPCDDAYGTLILNLQQAEIENIDGQLFRVIGPFTLQAQSNGTIRLGSVEFSHPYFPVPTPPGGIQSVNISFQDGIKENIGTVGPPNPFLKFTDHEDPKAGVRRNSDGAFDYLLSIAIQSISPLKQIKSGVSLDKVQCKENLFLIQKYDDSPACIFPESVQKLVERGWIGNIIKIEPKIMNAIESASIAKYVLEPEFEVQRDIAKEIFKSLRIGEDTPYISFGLSDDRKSLDLYFDKTAFTIEKNEAYYQEFIDEAFAEVTIPINVIFVEGKSSGDE